MAAEAIAFLAVAGALLGAGINALRAWYQSPETEKFSVKKFVGGLLSGGLAAIALVPFSELAGASSEGLVALFVTMTLAGAGASTLVSKLHS